MRIRIRNAEIQSLSTGQATDFPKYTSQLINQANFISKGTSPNVVGQMSELIHEFPGQSFSEWVNWYQQRHPTAIEDATDRIVNMLQKIEEAFPKIDRDMVQQWVEDLVLSKTFSGLKFQEAIFKRLAKQFELKYRPATPTEESQGIDGYLDEVPYSVKPLSYWEVMGRLPENISVAIISYEKVKSGIDVHLPDNLAKLSFG